MEDHSLITTEIDLISRSTNALLQYKSTFTYGYCCWMTWLIWGSRLPRSGHGCLKLMAVIKAIGHTAASLCRSKIIISKSREPFSISFFLALFLPSVSNYGAALLTLMLKSYSLLPEKTK